MEEDALPRHAFATAHETTGNVTFVAFTRIFKFHKNSPVFWDDFPQYEYIYTTMSLPIIL